MGLKTYTRELRELQAELCYLQEWVKHKHLRVIIVFEGRDAAGKGGTIKAVTERVSPRVFHVVALPAPISSPSERPSGRRSACSRRRQSTSSNINFKRT